MSNEEYQHVSFINSLDIESTASTDSPEQLLSPLDRICEEAGGIQLSTRYEHNPGRPSQLYNLQRDYLVGPALVHHHVDFQRPERRTEVTFLKEYANKQQIADLLKHLRGFYREDGMVSVRRAA